MNYDSGSSKSSVGSIVKNSTQKLPPPPIIRNKLSSEQPTKSSAKTNDADREINEYLSSSHSNDENDAVSNSKNTDYLSQFSLSNGYSAYTW